MSPLLVFLGESIAKALLTNGVPRSSLTFFESAKNRIAYVEKTLRLKKATSISDLVRMSRYVILAVKPQDSRRVLEEISAGITSDNILISIMAGVTTSQIISILEKPAKIVRTMPNICVKVGAGIIGISSNRLVSEKEIDKIRHMLSPLGEFIALGEEMMDAMTAIGGSGPAFFLLFLEAMIDAGVKIGLSRDKAKLATLQVAKGTLKMLEEENIHPTIMRDMITSPGGTTIAGIASLEESAFRGNLIKAIEKTCRRAKELST
ncbi:MAG TPA: pyrroline-5-carboxylate reductase [Syntrophorhabdaceae bacterium]|nr:pyrroline-5-carboxylate reductase [Syntrophorhabdaceae bacterium]